MNQYKRIQWRGHTFDRRTQAAILALEDRINRKVGIYQGSYSTAVGASGSTHAGGGAVDLWVPGMDPEAVVKAARKIGWAMWYRPAGPSWGDHCHGILRAHQTASPDAKLQVTDYDNRGDGLWPLTGHDDPQPYRPVDAPVRFSYTEWLRTRRLRDRIRHFTRTIASLKGRRRKARRDLARLT